MRRPADVAMLVDHMAHTLQGEAPVSIKCRIGVLDSADEGLGEDYAYFASFIDRVTSSGACRKVVVHARAAVLKGFSPADNREIPPLRYDFVTRLAADFPDLHVVLNGGIGSQRDFEFVKNTGEGLAGVMAGRWCLRNPLDLLEFRKDAMDPGVIVDAYVAYALRELDVVSKDEAADLLLPIALMFLSIDRQIDSLMIEDDIDVIDEILDRQYVLAWQIIEKSIPLLTALDCSTHKIDSHNTLTSAPPLRQFRNILGSVCGKKIISKLKKNTLEKIK